MYPARIFSATEYMVQTIYIFVPHILQPIQTTVKVPSKVLVIATFSCNDSSFLTFRGLVIGLVG